MRFSSLAAAASAAVFMGGVAQAQQKFDGNWSVEVITERGDCDKAYRFPVTIQGGRARYGGSESFAVTGSVAANGSLSGSISRGSQRANVRGRLSGRTGRGTWTTLSASPCSGRWNAEKRG